jgi:acetaldehyde dehydrogenase
MQKTKCAIIGSGNIGTDLMKKIVNTSESLFLNGVIGIDPESEGLAMAQSLNIPISSSINPFNPEEEIGILRD